MSKRRLVLSGALAVTLVAAGATAAALSLSGGHATARATHHWPRFEASLAGGVSEADRGSQGGPSQEAYDNEAYPATQIQFAQQEAAANAAKQLGKLPG